MSTRGHRPRLRDAVALDGRDYKVTAEAVAPKVGVWLGRKDGTAVCERFVAFADWRLRWNTVAQRWESK